MSTCCQKVRFVLAHKELPYESVILNLQGRENRSLEYLQINPKGVVPSVVDAGEIYCESNLIIQYLDERYTQKPLTPDLPLLRYRVREVLAEFDRDIHEHLAFLTGVHTFSADMKEQFPTRAEREIIYSRIPDLQIRQRHIDIVEDGFKSDRLPAAIRFFREYVNKLNQELLNREWLVGDNLSLADIAILPCILRLEHLNCSTIWAKHHCFSQWLENMKDTPGYKIGIENHFDTDYLKRLSQLSSGILDYIWNADAV